MCSSTRGPAMAPSLVTWPTSRIGRWVDLASWSRRAVASRTWVTEPGAEPTSSVNTVWIESTAKSAGRSCRARSITASTQFSVETKMSRSPMESRPARMRIWRTDSSPVT